MTLGEKLQSLRSERRISLGEVSRSTMIQIKYLEYLESGNYDKLPVDVYVKGFLRGYAEFLGVDENVLIKLYEKEKGIRKNLEKVSEKKPRKKESINTATFSITPKWIAIFLIVITVLGGVYYLYREVGNFANAPKLVILNPEQNSIENVSSIVVDGVTDKDAKVFINNKPVLVSDEGRFNEDLALQFGNNAINIKAVNRFDRVSTQNIMVQSTYKMESDEQQIDEQSLSLVELGQDDITIEVSVDPGPVWISVESDGNLVFSGNLLSGSTQNFTAHEKIVIDSGKADATRVKFNGNDVGVLGDKPEAIKGVVFDKNTKSE